VPFVLLFAFLVKDKRLKALAIVAGPFIINTFVLCNSRGAMIGMVVALLFTLLLSKRGHRKRMVYAAAAVVVMFFMLADQQFIARQQSTLHYEDEATAQNRISNWGSGYELLKDYPLGTGGYGFNQLSPIYAPAVAGARDNGRVSPHNTWILVASEWGVQGFILFICFVGSTFRLLHRVRRETTDQMTYYRSLAVQIGLIGTLAASTFSDRLYGESVYWLCGLAVVTFRIHQNAVAVAEEPMPRAPEWKARHAAGAA
jgi:O-antigen ligase